MKDWFFKPYEKVLREVPSLRDRPFESVVCFGVVPDLRVPLILCFLSESR